MSNMLNENQRIYTVSIVTNDDMVIKLEKRTRDEAKGALEHHFSSWTTKAMCVTNTQRNLYKWWFKTPEGTKTESNNEPEPAKS